MSTYLTFRKQVIAKLRSWGYDPAEVAGIAGATAERIQKLQRNGHSPGQVAYRMLKRYRQLEPRIVPAALMVQGEGKIYTIKAYREKLGVDIITAKMFVEAVMDIAGIDDSREPQPKPQPKPKPKPRDRGQQALQEAAGVLATIN